MAPVVIGYWKIRGLGQPIRYLLEYTGTDWEDKFYEAETTPPFSKDAWFKEKYTVGLDFPNLPYLIDGDIKLSQSKAILRYIARKHNLVGESDLQKSRIEMVEEEVEDFRQAFVNLCYSPNFEDLKATFLEKLTKKLEEFSTFLGDHTWLGGNEITYVDFSFYEILDEVRHLEPNALDNFKNLEELTKRFESLEAIAAYRSSPRFVKYPLHNPHAQFRGILPAPNVSV